MDHSIYRVFSLRLRERRRKAGLTLEQLAEQAGVTAAFIAHIEAERKRPTLQTVAKLAWALGSTAGRMLDEGSRGDGAKDVHLEQFERATRGLTAAQKDALLEVIKAAGALARRR